MNPTRVLRETGRNGARNGSRNSQIRNLGWLLWEASWTQEILASQKIWLKKTQGFIELIHSHCLFISHWQLRIYFTPSLQWCIWVPSSEATMAMANIWLVSSANMARASNGRRSGKPQVYRSLRKIMQRRLWKIQRDRKTYPSKIQCFHWNPYYIFVSSSFEVLEVLATAPGSVVTWSAGITDTLAPSFWSFRGWNVDFWIDDLWFSW